MSRLRANQITNENANGAPNFPHGITVTGIVTATTTSTTLPQIIVGSAVTANSQGIDVTGIVTATSFKGNGANLTNLNASNVSSGIVTSARLGGGTASATTFLNGHGNFADAGGGKLLQVVQNYDTSFTRDQITSTSFVATSHSVTIPPTKANSNIMLNFSGISNNDGAGQQVVMAIYRSIAGGSFAQFTPAGSNDPGRIGMNKGDQSRNEISFNIQYYDDPTYTLGNAIIYKLYAKSPTGHKVEIPSSPQGAPVLCIAQEIGA